MSAVVGIDLSTKALDLVKLNESDNRAEWVRCELEGKTAWGRTLDLHSALGRGYQNPHLGWWDDVLLVAIEAPYGHGSDLLNRVVGAIVSALPAHLRSAHRCWIVRPDEWKKGLGLKGKPTEEDFARLARPDLGGFTYFAPAQGIDGQRAVLQNARDAYCLAYWAREENARAQPKAALPGADSGEAA